MRFTVPAECSCGCSFSTQGYASNDFPPAICPNCNQHIHMLSPLSVSVIADRLLYRSHYEIESSDHTMSIICSAMALECAFTRAFLKWKKIDYDLRNIAHASEAENLIWEGEYKSNTRGAFKESANFVSQFLTEQNYNQFIDDLPVANADCRASLIHTEDIEREISYRRNRIMHWGEVSYGKDDAMSCHIAATGAISVLRLMDQYRLSKMEEAFKATRQRARAESR